MYMDDFPSSSAVIFSLLILFFHNFPLLKLSAQSKYILSQEASEYENSSIKEV